MLVLTRKVGEKIAIGDDIKIVVTATSKGAVKIGVDAPRAMKVVRGELEMKEEPKVLVSSH